MHKRQIEWGTGVPSLKEMIDGLKLHLEVAHEYHTPSGGVERGCDHEEEIKNAILALETRPAVERNMCKATIHFGNGHQSKGKCDVEGPHKQHHYEAEPGREYFWRGKVKFSGYFDESPEDQDPTAIRRTVVWKGTGAQEGKA